MAGYVLTSSIHSLRRPWVAGHKRERNMSAHYRLWGKKKDGGNADQEGGALESQLDEMVADEHASDFIISMLEDKMLGDEGTQQPYQGFRRERLEPPQRPPPMPELSSTNAVLEQQGQIAESRPHEPTKQPLHANDLPLESAPAMDINGFPEGVQTKAVNRGDTAVEGSNMMPGEQMLEPIGYTETSPMPFSTACAVAMCIVGAVRLGQTEEQVEALGNSRALKLLRQRQQDDFAANQARPGEDATSEQRIREARLKAAQQAEEEAARQKEYAAVAAEEAARDQMLRQKAKKEYEEAEARKAQELEKRVELERIMLRKRREELRAAEEAAQAARDEAEREAAAKRVERLERERQQAAEAAKAAEAEKLALNKLRDMLVARAEGSAVIAAAGPGLTTSGRVSVPATMEVSAEVKNVIAGEAGPVIGGAADVADAQDISVTVAGELAGLFSKQQMNVLVAQEAVGRGPLMRMTRLELVHWMNGFCMALQAAAMSKLRKACELYASSDAGKPQVQEFSIKVERGMLPQSHPKRSHALFEACLANVQQDRAAAESSVYDCLLALSEEERPWTEGTLVQTGVTESVHCQHIPDVCVAAHFVDYSASVWAGDSTEPPEWHQDVVSLAQNWLSHRTLEAKPDSLLDVAEMAYWAIGDKHPITLHMLEAAEKNLSLERKMAVVKRQRALDELVEKLQSKDKMTSSEISAELALEKEDLIPVPERVWALRNTASTMALAEDKRSRAKARDLFEMALQLQRGHVNDPGHPGLLGELWRLSQLLKQDEDWKNDSQELDEQMLEILCSVVDLYCAQGDNLSACVLAEATGIALGRLASSQDRLQQLVETASTLFDNLTKPEQDMVLKKRGTADAVESLILMFTEELGVYSIRSGNKSQKLWTDGKVLPLVQVPAAVRT